MNEIVKTIDGALNEIVDSKLAIERAANGSLDAAVILMAERVHADGLAIKAESLNELRSIIAPVVKAGVEAVVRAVGVERAAAAAAVIERDLPAQVVALVYNVQAQARAKSLAFSVADKVSAIHRKTEVTSATEQQHVAAMKTLAHPAAAALPVPQRSLSADEALAGINARESRKGSKR